MTTTERTLLLLRHAKSDWSGSVADPDRPLAERGRGQAPLAGRWLAGRADPIDLAIVSPAERARETWELASAELPSAPSARVDERVYAASADRLLSVLREVPDEVRTVLLIGHNPGMEQLASRLAGEDLILRTAGIAEFGVTGAWSGVGRGPAVLRAAGRSDGRTLG